jgi:predicted DNA-binding protein (MmcQ/YjbR family)
MSDAARRYTDDVPDDLVARVRELCAELPETHEEPAWKGIRWRVRTRTFAHVLGLEDAGTEPSVVLAFRSTGEELEALRHAGPPFLVLGWGRDALGLVLDDRTDWDEVREVITESYCALAPKKLVARIDRPDDATSDEAGPLRP